MSFNFNYKYYDTPEGQDIYMKTFAVSKYAAVTGLALGTYDVLLYSHPKGILNTAARYLYHTGPLIGMATAFAVTTNAVQNIRGKNDKINYFLGGLAAGSVFSIWQKTAFAGVPVAIALGFIAVAKKTGIDDGWVFFPPVVQSTQSAHTARNDWTLMKDLPKGWTSGN